MDISLEIHCDLCGSANYSLPADTDAAAELHCNDCGADIGTLAELQAEIAALATSQSAEALRRGLDTFIGDGGSRGETAA
jgi:hypothetical protein